MKKCFTLFILSITLSTLSFGQTKMIAHKSHSGSTATFKNSLASDLFNNKGSNFGIAPVRTIKNAVLDSVIFLTDSTAIMVTSNYCTDRWSNDTNLWKAGKDTVRNHPLFSKQHSLSTIKKTLDERYHFSTPVDSTVFIGYDNGELQTQTQTQQTQAQQAQSQPQTKREIRKQKRKNKKNRLTPFNELDRNNQSGEKKLMQKFSSIPLFYLVLALALFSFVFAFAENRISQKK